MDGHSASAGACNKPDGRGASIGMHVTIDVQSLPLLSPE